MTRSACPRILVVEDDPGIRRVLVRYLALQGCAVEVAEDGEQGLERLLVDEFDAVILDVHLPKLDGPAVWQAITAKRPAWRDRFVFVSAVAPQPLPEVQYLRKPFELDALWAIVQGIVRTQPEHG